MPVDAQDADLRTPLLLAAYSDKADLVQLLLRFGADVNAQDRAGTSPLHIAAGSNPELMQLALSSGTDVNLMDGSGKTPLHGAASVGMLAGAQALLAAGADVNARDMVGKTPLYLAKEHGHYEVVNFLSHNVGTE